MAVRQQLTTYLSDEYIAMWERIKVHHGESVKDAEILRTLIKQEDERIVADIDEMKALRLEVEDLRNRMGRVESALGQAR